MDTLHSPALRLHPRLGQEGADGSSQETITFCLEQDRETYPVNVAIFSVIKGSQEGVVISEGDILVNLETGAAIQSEAMVLYCTRLV